MLLGDDMHLCIFPDHVFARTSFLKCAIIHADLANKCFIYEKHMPLEGNLFADDLWFNFLQNQQACFSDLRCELCFMNDENF